MIRIVLECLLQFVFELVLRFVQWLTELWNLKSIKKICVQLHVTQCLKRAELAVLGCLVSAGRRNQRDSPKFSVEKNPLEFGKSTIWAWYVAK